MNIAELIAGTVAILFLLGLFLHALVRLVKWYKTRRPSRRFLLTHLLPGLILAVAAATAYTLISWQIMAAEQAQPLHTVTGQVTGLDSQRISGRYSSYHMYYIRLEGDPNRYHALFLERRSKEFLAVAGSGPVTLWYTGEGRTREARAVQLADGTFFHTLEQSESHDTERIRAGAWIASAIFLLLGKVALDRPRRVWARPEAERRARREGNRYLLRLLLISFAVVFLLFLLASPLLISKPVSIPVTPPLKRAKGPPAFAGGPSLSEKQTGKVPSQGSFA